MGLIVSVKDLYEKVKEMHDDKMDFVELTFYEADSSDPDDSSCIRFTAWTEEESFEGTDYEEVDGIVSEL